MKFALPPHVSFLELACINSPISPDKLPLAALVPILEVALISIAIDKLLSAPVMRFIFVPSAPISDSLMNIVIESFSLKPGVTDIAPIEGAIREHNKPILSKGETLIECPLVVDPGGQIGFASAMGFATLPLPLVPELLLVQEKTWQLLTS